MSRLDHQRIDIDSIDVVRPLGQAKGKMSDAAANFQHTPRPPRKSPQQFAVVVGVMVPSEHLSIVGSASSDRGGLSSPGTYPDEPRERGTLRTRTEGLPGSTD